MKTTDKVQKTGNQKFNKVLSIVFSAVVGLVLISSTISTQVKNSNETLQVESWITNESYFTNLPDLSKVEEELEYKAEEFVNAEMKLETESNNAVVEAESALQVETLTNESEYNASKFVEVEISVENENWMNNEEFLESAEALTADGSELEVAKYAQKVINESVAENAFEDAANRSDKNFINAAEALTANGSEQEIAKYAQKQINATANELTFEVKARMTDENFFTAADVFTTNGTEQEISKYAEKQLIYSIN